MRIVTERDSVYLAFYKADKQDGHYFDDIISGYTGLFNKKTPKYSHVEIGFSNKDDGSVHFFSATTRSYLGGKSGTRWIPAKDMLKHLDRWDVYTRTFSMKEVRRMVFICNCEEGKPYDWAGIFGFGTPFGTINDKGKWYCSEIVNYVVTVGDWMKRISPRRLWVKAVSVLNFKPMLNDDVKKLRA